MIKTGKIFTVSELSRNIKSLLEDRFGEIWVEGEISGFKVSSLGHVYFDLKDKESVISVVMFRSVFAYLKFKPENGLLVKVRGLVTSYLKQSKYQINAREIVPGEYGPLQLAFEQLKRKLAAEGLFDEERKKSIPKFPEKVVVLTSLCGAAVRDILSILKRRFSGLKILLVPVKVQGEGAAQDMAEALDTVNKNFPETDVLLLGRGGGSMEDLWAFNEEILARAIAASKIPVISCVGHETDFTIADFVSDLRAPTPSAAAGLVIRNKEEIRTRLFQVEKNLLQSLKIVYENAKGKFLRLAGSRIFRNPYVLVESHVQSLDEAVEGLNEAIESKIKGMRERLNYVSGKLSAFNPYLPLRKGYSIIKGRRGIVKSARDVVESEKIDIKFGEGSAKAVISSVNRDDVFKF